MTVVTAADCRLHAECLYFIIVKYLSERVHNGRMKPFLLVFLFLVTSLPVLADVSVSVDKSLYNFGDQILVSYDVSSDADFSGLAKLSLVCSDFGIEFYTLPTTLYAGQVQSVGVPGLEVASDMKGRCYVLANVSSFSRNVQFEDSSESFNVTGSLPVFVSVPRSVVSPSDELVVSGAVAKSYSSRGAVSLSLLGNSYGGVVVNNSFSYNVRLPSNIKSGRHSLDFLVNDSSGNSGSASASFSVEAVPTKLSVALSNETVLPGSLLGGSVVLLDQAGDVIAAKASISVIDSFGASVLGSSVTMPSDFGFALPSSFKPGSYSVLVSSSGLNSTASFVVPVVESVNVSFDSGALTVVNTGNIDYRRELVVSLNGSSNLVVVSRDFELKPDGSALIDLYAEVPEDSYVISFPGLANSPSFEAHLLDERSAFRKAGDFFGVTGNVVSGSRFDGVSGVFSWLLAVAVAGVLVFVVYRRMRRGRKKGVNKAASVKDEPSPAYDAETAALKRYLDSKREQQRQESLASSAPSTQPSFSRTDDSVKKWMENLHKDKPFK